MELAHFKRVHCVGIGGIGISAVAKWWLAQGATVSGSDLQASEITEALVKRGVAINYGPSQAEWLGEEVDLVIYSEAVPESAPERQAAAERGIRQMGHFDFLGELSKEYRTICVTGTNGKSTTTAMVGKILEAAGLSPTVFVGSLVPGWSEGNFLLGQGEWLVIEGDEYKQKMVKLWPEVTVVTNIEEDHLDVYRDLDHILETFAECARKTRQTVWLNADDRNSRLMLEKIPQDERRVKYFASDLQGAAADLVAAERQAEAGAQTFTLKSADKSVKVTLQIPGAFNALNATTAAAAAQSAGVDLDVSARVLGEFAGIWRRFERVGEFKGATVISDYAHHPTALKATLAATKEFFPGQRLVVLFEPHQHSRTKELFDDFAQAFGQADVLILSEIYRVAGRTEADEVSSEQLLKAVLASDQAPKSAHYAANLAAAEDLLRAEVKAGDVILIIGAGKVDEVARHLVAK